MPLAQPLTVAVLQTRPVAGDITANALDHARLIESSAEHGARVCVFPELSLTGYELDAIAADGRGCTMALDDPRFDAVQEACRKSGVYALVGAPLRDSDGVRLATVVIGPAGQPVASYTKRNLHGPELDIFIAGNDNLLLDIDGWRLGLAVCYDAAVPEHAEGVRADGADAYLVSALYETGAEHRLTEQMTRAAGLGMWVALAQYTGATGPYLTCGGSGVWAPGGAVAQQLGEREEGAAVVTFTSPAP